MLDRSRRPANSFVLYNRQCINIQPELPSSASWLWSACIRIVQAFSGWRLHGLFVSYTVYHHFKSVLLDHRFYVQDCNAFGARSCLWDFMQQTFIICLAFWCFPSTNEIIYLNKAVYCNFHIIWQYPSAPLNICKFVKFPRLTTLSNFSPRSILSVHSLARPVVLLKISIALKPIRPHFIMVARYI